MTTTPEGSGGPPGDRRRYYETLVARRPVEIWEIVSLLES